MGSIIDYIECPVCIGNDCMEEYNYKTGEFYIFCAECGYIKEFFIERDSNGKMIKKDNDKELTLDNVTYKKIEVADPYGAFRTEFKTNHICLGTLKNELEYEKYVSEIISVQNEISLSVVSRYVDGKINKEIIYQ